MKSAYLREHADHKEISAFLRNIVPAGDIGPRKEGFDFKCGYSRIPSKPKTYKAWLEKRLDSEVERLAAEQKKYEEYRLNGVDMLDDASLASKIGDPTEAAISVLEQEFYLLGAHISASLSQIEGLQRELKIVEADADLIIPPGYELVDAYLPARQAFIVKKWGDAAKVKIKGDRR